MPAPDTRLINVPTARALAAKAGTPVKADTILAAARRGTIAEASKVKGRWLFPVWAFDEWLLVHSSRADYDPATAGDSPQP